jgi:hypothetical protein
MWADELAADGACVDDENLAMTVPAMQLMGLLGRRLHHSGMVILSQFSPSL